MELDLEKIKKLMSDIKFVAQLNSSMNNRKKFIGLFKERGVNLSPESFNEITKAKENMSKLSEEDLINVSGGGGGRTTTVIIHEGTPVTYRESTPLQAGTGIIVGGVIAVIGSALALYSLRKSITHGIHAPL